VPTAAPWADVVCRASPDGRPHRPQSKSGHRSRRSGKPTGSVCQSSPLPSCVLQLAPPSPAQAATTTRGRPQLRPQDWIRSQTPGSPPVRRSQTSAAATLRAVKQCRSPMVGSPGHQLADPDHQQCSPHNAQICAAGAERGIDAATAPNGGYRAARHPAKLLTWVSAAADRAGCRPLRGPRSSSATAVMSDLPVSLTSCLQSLAGAGCAGCRCLPGRGSAAGRLAPGPVIATRVRRGHRTARHS
jgi:hypothetical protein